MIKLKNLALSLLASALFTTLHVSAQDITGDWYMNEFEYSKPRGSNSSTSMGANIGISIEALGGNQFRVEIEGEDEPEILQLSQQGNRFFIEEFEEFEEEGYVARSREALQWISNDLMFLTRATINYGGEFDRLYYFEAGAVVFTRTPLPAVQPSLWPGDYNLQEIGMEAYNSLTHIELFDDETTVGIAKMAGNTYLGKSPEDSFNLSASGNSLVLNRTIPGYGRISYQDSMWRVTVTSEEMRIRIIQVDDQHLFGMHFYSRNAILEARDPEAMEHPPAPEVLLEAGETNSFLLTRISTEAPEVSPLATSETGNFLSGIAFRLSPPSGPSPDTDWFWIEWFGYFKLYGLSHGYHSEFGSFYFGADGFAESPNGAWIYLNDWESWLYFSPDYGYGRAYSPTEGAVIELGGGA